MICSPSAAFLGFCVLSLLWLTFFGWSFPTDNRQVRTWGVGCRAPLWVTLITHFISLDLQTCPLFFTASGNLSLLPLRFYQACQGLILGRRLLKACLFGCLMLPCVVVSTAWLLFFSFLLSPFCNLWVWFAAGFLIFGDIELDYWCLASNL